MKLKNLVNRKLIKEGRGPYNRSPEAVAEYIKQQITPDMTEEDIWPLIETAITELATEYAKKNRMGPQQVKTIVWNVVKNDEDYIPDVLDALIALGVKYDRLATAKRDHPGIFKDDTDFGKDLS